MFAITLEAFRVMWKPPYLWREFICQCWFIGSVSMFPAMLVSTAFGATIALQVGNVATQLGPNHRPELRWSSRTCARRHPSLPLCRPVPYLAVGSAIRGSIVAVNIWNLMLSSVMWA